MARRRRVWLRFLESQLCRRACPERAGHGNGSGQARYGPNRDVRQFCLRIANRKAGGSKLSCARFGYGEFSKGKISAPNEKAEDKAKLDQDFRTRQSQLARKLAIEQQFENRPYLIVRTTIDQLVQDRNSLLQAKPPVVPVPSVPGSLRSGHFRENRRRRGPNCAAAAILLWPSANECVASRWSRSIKATGGGAVWSRRESQ